jgi:hypothetical protein
LGIAGIGESEKLGFAHLKLSLGLEKQAEARTWKQLLLAMR